MLSLHSIHSDFQYGDTLALVIKLYISHFRSQRHMNTASGRIRFFCGYLVEKCCNSCLSSVLGIFRLQLFNFILKILCIFKFNLSSSVIDRLKEGSVTLNGLDCRVDTFARLPRDWLWKYIDKGYKESAMIFPLQWSPSGAGAEVITIARDDYFRWFCWLLCRLSLWLSRDLYVIFVLLTMLVISRNFSYQ